MGLWDLHQEMSIRSLSDGAAADRLGSEDRADHIRNRTEDVEDRLDRLLLLTEAFFELLAEKEGLTEDQLAAKVAEIDKRDGTLDGRLARPARPCPQCGAKVPKSRATCMFCGAAVPGSGPFDAV